jgi:hypothetical protein
MTDTHECDGSDILTVETIRKMIKCPKCNIVVERSEGCDSMTCASCGENFSYSTGMAGGHGSHNAPVNLSLGGLATSFSDMIAKTENPKLFTRLISEVEAAKPTSPKETRIENVLIAYRKSGDEDVAIMDIIKAFGIHCKHVQLYRGYIRHINDIESQLQAGSLTESTLREIHSTYCSSD